MKFFTKYNGVGCQIKGLNYYFPEPIIVIVRRDPHPYLKFSMWKICGTYDQTFAAATADPCHYFPSCLCAVPHVKLLDKKKRAMHRIPLVCYKMFKSLMNNETNILFAKFFPLARTMRSHSIYGASNPFYSSDHKGNFLKDVS